MKKMIVLLAAIAMIGIGQAAMVNWAIDLGKTDYANKTYYIFAGSDAATVEAALGAVDGTTATTFSGMALATGALNAKAGKASGSLDVGTQTSLYTLVLDGTLEAGQTYIAGTMDISSLTYNPPNTPPGTLTAQKTAFTQSGTMSAGGGGDVPEPTSGLLLLVGGAMLALRRKQK